MFWLGYNREVHIMGRILVTGTEAFVDKITSSLDFTDISSQWALGYVELKVKQASQSSLMSKVKKKKTGTILPQRNQSP
jgi:hypothetical protein